MWDRKSRSLQPYGSTSTPRDRFRKYANSDSIPLTGWSEDDTYYLWMYKSFIIGKLLRATDKYGTSLAGRSISPARVTRLIEAQGIYDTGRTKRGTSLSGATVKLKLYKLDPNFDESSEYIKLNRN